MTAGPTMRLTRVHDALIQQLAETRADVEGLEPARARRDVELDVLVSGICAVQREEREYAEAVRLNHSIMDGPFGEEVDGP